MTPDAVDPQGGVPKADAGPRAQELLHQLEIAEADTYPGCPVWDSGNFRWAAAVVRELIQQTDASAAFSACLQQEIRVIVDEMTVALRGPFRIDDADVCRWRDRLSHVDGSKVTRTDPATASESLEGSDGHGRMHIERKG